MRGARPPADRARGRRRLQRRGWVRARDMRAAADAGVWAVGVDSDQSVLGPHVLTSVLKSFEAGFAEVLRQVEANRVRTGRDTVLTMRDGSAGLGRISPKVPRSLVGAGGRASAPDRCGHGARAGRRRRATRRVTYRPSVSRPAADRRRPTGARRGTQPRSPSRPSRSAPPPPPSSGRHGRPRGWRRMRATPNRLRRQFRATSPAGRVETSSTPVTESTFDTPFWPPTQTAPPASTTGSSQPPA